MKRRILMSQSMHVGRNTLVGVTSQSINDLVSFLRLGNDVFELDIVQDKLMQVNHQTKNIIES